MKHPGLRLHVVESEMFGENAYLAHLSLRDGIVGIVTDLGRQMESDGQAGLSLLQQKAIPPVRLLGGTEAGILAHSPQPPTVHGGLHAAGVRVLAGKTEFFQVLGFISILAFLLS